MLLLVIQSLTFNSTPLSSTQFPDQLKNQNFIINNSGYSSLFWSIQEDSSTSNVCANPSDIAWLTVNPSSGSIPLGSNQPVTITYNLTDLTPGEYSGSICLTSNDASQSLIEIGITLTVSPAIYGVALGADQVGSGKPEQTIIYTIAITNTSPDVADNFDLSISSAWSAYLPNESIENLPSGESTTFTVEITVHPGAVVGAQDIATVTATSRHNSGANDNILLTSTALIAYAVDLQVSQEASGYPGDTIIYTVDITNTSPNTVDSFNLSLNSLWGAHLSIENINNLAIGETSSFSVEVSIPTDAMAFDQDIATITATSQGDLEVKDTTFLTSTVLPIYGVDLNSDQSGAAKPGEKINYLMQIVNTSPNAEDTFNIESSGNWIDVLSKTSVTLGPGGSTTFNVEIDVPPAAAIGAVDIATITATSQNNGSVVGTAYLTSTALAAYGVDLQSDGTASTEPGKTITYTIHITNVSPNAEDTFVIFVDGLWSASISEPSVTLAAGASTTFTVQVVVPINSVDGEQEITTITANSQNDPTATDIIKSTSYCSYYKMYIPSISR